MYNSYRGELILCINANTIGQEVGYSCGKYNRSRDESILCMNANTIDLEEGLSCV